MKNSTKYSECVICDTWTLGCSIVAVKCWAEVRAADFRARMEDDTTRLTDFVTCVTLGPCVPTDDGETTSQPHPSTRRLTPRPSAHPPQD